VTAASNAKKIRADFYSPDVPGVRPSSPPWEFRRNATDALQFCALTLAIDFGNLRAVPI